MRKPADGPGADLSVGVAWIVKAHAPYALLIVAIWLGCQILLVPIMERAPVDIASRLAPTSQIVLRRAAESELAAYRYKNAEHLARRAVQAAPFDIRALSVLGMAMAERDRAAANEVLTLAGNWSLRDDPTHVWLTHERLRRGDYVSAFAHADTLVRRRDDIQPVIFNLFKTAALGDPKSLPALIGLLAAAPPWRDAFWDNLYADPEGDDLLGSLAIGLQDSAAPLDDRELGRLYSHWLGKGRVAALQAVRQRIGRPAADMLVVDGDFTGTSALTPFAWTLHQSAGFSAAVMDDDRRAGEHALRVDYDGFGSGTVVHQFLLLPAGAHRLVLEGRIEGGARNSGLAWRLECGNDSQIAEIRPMFSSGDGGWKRFETSFTVSPACPGQWLVLTTLPGDRRGPRIVSWFDRIRIERHAK